MSSTAEILNRKHYRRGEHTKQVDSPIRKKIKIMFSKAQTLTESLGHHYIYDISVPQILQVRIVKYQVLLTPSWAGVWGQGIFPTKAKTKKGDVIGRHKL